MIGIWYNFCTLDFRPQYYIYVINTTTLTVRNFTFISPFYFSLKIKSSDHFFTLTYSLTGVYRLVV